MNSRKQTLKSDEIPWRRVWLNRRVTFQANYDGFFPQLDPRRFTGPVPDYTHLDQLSHIRCLVLLGDPGMGKSFELRSHCLQLQERYSEDAVFWTDVQDTRNMEQALGDIFSAKLPQHLRAHNGTVFILVDTLDSNELGVSRGIKHLHERLVSIAPVDRRRVHLRLTCRTTDWLEEHERFLASAFPQEPFANDIAFWAYLLAPLTRSDIAEAATKRGITDTDAFLAQIGQARAQGLAERPLTLRLLLDAGAQGKHLPSDLIWYWREGLTKLCAETDAIREEDASAACARPEEIHECAEHVAALAMFTGGSFWTQESSRDKRPWNAITTDDLRRDMTYRAGPPHDASAALVRSTLRCGLFAGRGESPQFAHRAYAEFLAADCLHTRQVPWEDTLRLLRDPHDPHGRILPQLREVAGWLAAMNRDVRVAIVVREPQLLLRAGERYYQTAPDREQLVDRILDGLRDEALSEEPHDAPLYAGLKHPGIEAQLAIRLRDPSVPDAVWRVARSIAASCGVALPFADLARVACDVTVRASKRAFAATLVVNGDEDAKRSLLPILQEPDVPDGVFGICLRALWPTHLSAESLVPLLRPPRNENIFDEYHHFLSDPLFRGLRDRASLATVLRGVGTRAELGESRMLSSLVRQLMRHAWVSLEDSTVADAFAEVLLARLLEVVRSGATFPLDSMIEDARFIDYSGGWPGSLREQIVDTEDRRRSVVQRLVRSVAQSATVDDDEWDRIVDILVLASPPLARGESRGWIELQANTTAENERVYWRTLSRGLDEAQPILASPLTAHASFSGSRVLSDQHRDMIQRRSWLQRVHSWREDRQTPTATSVASPAATSPATPATTKRERSVAELSDDFRAHRSAIQRALAKARMPVRGSSDLLDAVLASLKRLQVELQGPTPLAFTLWNEHGDDAYPKYEDDLSDVIKTHLERELPATIAVVVSREPEIRRGDGYLDLLIEAPGPPDGRTQVILEVKRDDNVDLRRAMQTQLCERYLHETGAKFGLYVVGWFGARHSLPSATLETLRDELIAQASSLSRELGIRVESVVLDCHLATTRRGKPVKTREASRARTRKASTARPTTAATTPPKGTRKK